MTPIEILAWFSGSYISIGLVLAFTSIFIWDTKLSLRSLLGVLSFIAALWPVFFIYYVGKHAPKDLEN